MLDIRLLFVKSEIAPIQDVRTEKRGEGTYLLYLPTYLSRYTRYSPTQEGKIPEKSS